MDGEERQRLNDFMETVMATFRNQEMRMGEIEELLDHFVNRSEQSEAQTTEALAESRNQIEHCRRMIHALRQSCQANTLVPGLPDVFPV